MKLSKKYIELIISLFAVLLFVIFIFSVHNYRIKTINSYKKINVNSMCDVYINNTLEKNITATNLNLKNFNKGDVIKLSLTLPNIDIKNPIVSLYNKNNSIKITYDNKIIFANDEYENNSKVYGMGIIEVPIENDFQNKELSIELTIADCYLSNTLSPIIIINSYHNSNKFIMDNIFAIFISLFGIIIGMLSILIITYYIAYNNNAKKIFLSSIIAFLASVLFAIYYGGTSIIIDDSKKLYIALYNFAFLTIMFLAIFTLDNLNKNKYIYPTLCLSVVFILVANLLQLYELFYLSRAFKIYLLLYTIPFVLYCKYLFINRINLYKNKLLSLPKLLLFNASIFVIVIIFLLYLIAENKNFLIYLYTLTIIYIVKFVYDYFYNQAQSYKIKIEKQALLSLVYKDTLTGIANRRAVDKFITEKSEQNLKSCGIFSFDLNNLKYVNDTYGHIAGDILIKKFAEALTLVEEFSLIARTGGDEYIGFIENPDSNTEHTVNVKLEQIVNMLNTKTNTPYKITYAIGYSEYHNSNNLSIYDSITNADKKMYENKMDKKEFKL